MSEPARPLTLGQRVDRVLDALPQEHEAAAVKYAALERRVEALERKAYGFRC